jgi:hypothetical protein
MPARPAPAAPPPDAARLRAWWAHRQGLDGTLAGTPPADVLARSGWARSVGGAGPYLTLAARAGTARADADAAVARREIHELPAARGCTYVVPAADYALALACARAQGDGEMAVARTLGVTDAEIDRLCDAVVAALAGDAREPDAIRAAVGGAARSLGEAGKKKGLSTTLPLALGRLQAAGRIRRVPADGRLDRQRYRYARWDDAPRWPDGGDPFAALARRYFAWNGPATLAEWQWFSGLGARAARAAAEPLGLAPAWPGSDRLLLPGDAAAFRDFDAPATPRYALLGSLDALFAARRDPATLLDPADAARPAPAEGRTSGGRAPRPLGALQDLPSHAIIDRGRLVGLWEYDADAGDVAWATFDDRHDQDALRAAVDATAARVRDQLGDARSFSLDSPASRRPRLAALRDAVAGW